MCALLFAAVSGVDRAGGGGPDERLRESGNACPMPGWFAPGPMVAAETRGDTCLWQVVWGGGTQARSAGTWTGERKENESRRTLYMVRGSSKTPPPPPRPTPTRLDSLPRCTYSSMFLGVLPRWNQLSVRPLGLEAKDYFDRPEGACTDSLRVPAARRGQSQKPAAEVRLVPGVPGTIDS